MSLQDLFPYNPDIAGLNSVFIKHQDSYQINMPCIKCPDQIVMTGKTYIMICASRNGTADAQSVELLDVFCYAEYLYLLVRDTESHVVSLLHMFMDIIDYNCSWRLLDYEYLKMKAEGQE